MKQLRKYIFASAALAGFFLPSLLLASTGTIDSVDYRSRLCTNVDCSTYTIVYWTTTHGTPVSITDSALTGDIWSESFGWINLNPTHGGVHNSTSGILSGYAWGETASWVNFSPTHGGVTINPSTGEFLGWAWVSGAGWMHFDCSLGADACVKTNWRPTSGTTTGGSGGGSGTILLTTSTTTSGTGTTGSGGTTGGTGTTGTSTAGTTTGGTSGTGTTIGGTTTTSGTTGTTTGGTTTTGTVTGDTTGSMGTTGATTGGMTTTGGTTGMGSGTGGSGLALFTNAIGTIGRSIKNTFTSFGQNVASLWNTAKEAVATGDGKAIGTIVAGVGVVAGIAITVTAGILLHPMSFSEIFLIPVRIWSVLMAALGLKRRRKPWGIVYDSVTKVPLHGAVLTLQDSDGTKVAETTTDSEGRYDFVVPATASYSLFVRKSDYVFPSQKLVGHDHDEINRDLYFGEHFHVASTGEFVTKNVPMDPEKFDWREFSKHQQHKMKFYIHRDKMLRRISDFFLVFGFILATILVFVSPHPYNISIFLLYCILFLVREYSSFFRPFGGIINAATGTPIPFAIIRISSASTGFEVMQRIADAKGRYYIHLPNGDYKIRIDRKMPDSTYQTIGQGIPATVTRGYLAKTFSLTVSSTHPTYETPAPLE